MRTIELTVPPDRTDAVLAKLGRIEAASLRLQRGGSLHPPGDVVTLQVTNGKLGVIMRIADELGLGSDEGVAMSTSVPLSVVTPAFRRLTRETGATTWEELELSMSEDSTMTRDRTLVMLLAGVIAGVGIIADQLHTVVGAMIIAPGFQPFARVVLGLVTRSSAWRGGLVDVARAYGALLIGAALAALLGMAFGTDALDAGGDSYLGDAVLLEFWTTVSWTGVVVGAAGAVCGGILVSLNRTVLTAGVMVALALVPTAALVPMAFIAGDPGLAGRAAGRFGVEVALVLAGITLMFTVKRRLDRRSTTD
ncbi:MAG TPA: DUF389 domain-containing protein [Egicoccus sp.]|nr:DUF389 domain-containing protein [Egicoccus sp.]HSK23874.1 DUF389 domain-containing protein [Egicoccus sp.]